MVRNWAKPSHDSATPNFQQYWFGIKRRWLAASLIAGAFFALGTASTIALSRSQYVAAGKILVKPDESGTLTGLVTDTKSQLTPLTVQGIQFQDDMHGTVENYYFDERLRRAEDIECWLRISIQTHWRHEGIPEVLTLYRITTSGLSANALQQLEALQTVVEKTRSYAPDIIAHCEKAAKAYHLRYTARRLVSLGDGVTSVKLFNQALTNHWRILLEEPQRTLLTGIAAYVIWLFNLITFTIAKSEVSEQN